MAAPTAARANVDPAELERFNALAARWWDTNGPSRALHDLNPARLGFVAAGTKLAGARVCDVGCGGGILSEALSRAGAEVVALDLAEDVLGAARLHALESGLSIDYRLMPVERLAEAEPERYDAVTCMELLEHVPDPAAFVGECARLLKPDGRLYVSTLNRTPQSFLTAIVGAEYVAGLLPKGTHQFAQFIRPSELSSWLRAAGLQPLEVAGLQYRPITRRAWVGGSPSINYLASAAKPA